MGLIGLLMEYFWKDEDRHVPDKCCKVALSWEDFKVSDQKGAYSSCKECKTLYLKKEKSELFISNDRPQVYSREKGGTWKHYACKSEAYPFFLPTQIENGEMFMQQENGLIPKISYLLYCPGCENINPRQLPIEDRLSSRK